MCKGGGTNTVEQQSAPNPQFLNAYQNAVDQAQIVANLPLQQYQGNTVAPLSSDQQAGINEIEQNQGTQNQWTQGAANYLDLAGNEITNSTTPLWGGVQQFSPNAVGQYESPYTQQVVGATEAQLNNQNAQQQAQLAGNGISQGAFGGDRQAVAAGILGGQQQLQEAPTIAGLENQGYTQGLQEFNTQQQAQLGANEANAWLGSQAGFGLANLGNEWQGLGTTLANSNLNEANALVGAGGLTQQEQQEELNVPYENFLQQQAYPFQTTGWLSNISEGLGSAAGGTSSTSYPGASTGSQILGTGLATTGLLGMTGAFGANGYLTGASGLFGSGAAGLDAAGADTGFDLGATAAATGTADAAGSVGAADAVDALAFAARGGMIPRRFTHRGMGGAMNDNWEGGWTEPKRAYGGFADGGMPDFSPPDDSLGMQPATAMQPPQGVGGDPWKALTYAGLGIMGGNSSHASENIGRGALEGLKEYSADQSRAQQAQSLSAYRNIEAQESQARQAEQHRHNTADEQTAAQRLADQLQEHADTVKHQDAELGIASGHLGIAQGELAERVKHDNEELAKPTGAELEGQNIKQLMLPKEQGGLGMTLPDAIEAAKGYAGRASRASQALTDRETNQSATNDYRQQMLKLKQAGMSDAEISNTMNNAARLVGADLTGKTTFEGAVNTIQGQRQSLSPQANAPAPRPATPSVPPGAIDFLRKNPALAPQFQQKYGVDPKQYLPGS